MTRVLLYILAGVIVLATPVMAKADTGRANERTLQLTQSTTTDGRVQNVQPLGSFAPNTRAIGPTVRPYGSTGDDWRRDGVAVAPPSLPAEGAERPPLGYTNMWPNQGLNTIPRGY